MCSDFLSDLILNLKEIIQTFVKVGFSRKFIEDTSFDYYFIRNVSRLLSQDINILDALTEVNGWSGDIGFELAKYKIRKFYTINHEIPTNYQLPSISTAIKKGRWNKFDVTTWNQMLNLSIGMVNTKSNGYYVGKSGLDNATAEAKEFYDLHNRLPYSTELITIKTKIVEGYWKDFGLNTWNDFLTSVFDDINIKRQDLSKFRGKSGLAKVVQLIKSHYHKFGEIPSNRDFSSFDYLARNGIWKKYGIKSWNDLLYYAIRMVNQVKNKYSRYKSRGGLNLAKSDAIQFNKDNGCKPTKRDLPGINQAVNNEYWIDFSINTWNDFMKFTFGEVNTKRNGYYKGKAGLERALQEARDIFYQKRKLPVKRDMRTVYSLINDRNYWTEFGINSWSDFRDRI